MAFIRRVVTSARALRSSAALVRVIVEVEAAADVRLNERRSGVGVELEVVLRARRVFGVFFMVRTGAYLVEGMSPSQERRGVFIQKKPNSGT